MRVLRYAFEEAVASLWRGRRAGLLSVATIAIALFVLGTVLLVTSNLDRLSREWSQSAGLSVYLADGVTPADRSDIERVLAPGAVVVSSAFVSKADALQRFSATFADLASTAASLGENPFPASYEVRLSSPTDPAAVDALVAKLGETQGVSDVRYDKEWLERLASLVAIVRTAGLALGTVLAMAAALTVANVVRLALYARRDELEIMQLVGAPQAYVRGPFVMEGLLQGGIGALGALAVLAVFFLVVHARYLAPAASALNLSSIRFLSPGVSAMLLAGGMAVGCLGGIVAASGRTSSVG